MSVSAYQAAACLGPGRKRIAVVGSGIAGLLCARLLCREHDVTVFEQDGRIGGHTHTVEEQSGGRTFPVDTGFIVFNERNYPGLVRMFAALGVPSRESTMSFSVRCERTGLEYCGSTLGTLFAQRRNLLRPRFWGMIRDILRFHRLAPDVLSRAEDPSLREVMAEGRYGSAFVEQYLVPMAAAIWSAEPSSVLDMPARFLIRFFKNHGMLQVEGRPIWRTVLGGSRSYLQPLAAPFADRIHKDAAVSRVERTPSGVTVHAKGRPAEAFDAAVLCCHSDQSLRILSDADADERAVLSAVRYQPNEVVLHTDTTILPKRRRAWAAWNYHIPAQAQGTAAVSYCMNILQGLESQDTFVVTLNRSSAIDERRVLRRFVYDHPIFDASAVAAQQALPAIQGKNRVWFAGAWCGNGFHEDGVQSALAVCRDFGLTLDELERQQAAGATA